MANLPAQKFKEKYTARQMYKDEFNMICKKQKKFYPDILTSDFIREIWNFIFYQRPLKIQKNLVGNCTFFKNRKRAEQSSLIAQEFLIYKQISDLKYKNHGEYYFQDLLLEQKKILVEYLMKNESLAFLKAKKMI